MGNNRRSTDPICPYCGKWGFHDCKKRAEPTNPSAKLMRIERNAGIDSQDAALNEAPLEIPEHIERAAINLYQDRTELFTGIRWKWEEASDGMKDKWRVKAFAAAMRPEAPTVSAVDAAREIMDTCISKVTENPKTQFVTVTFENNKAAAIIQRLLDAQREDIAMQLGGHEAPTVLECDEAVSRKIINFLGGRGWNQPDRDKVAAIIAAHRASAQRAESELRAAAKRALSDINLYLEAHPGTSSAALRLAREDLKTALTQPPAADGKLEALDDIACFVKDRISAGDISKQHGTTILTWCQRGES